jgi:hypothetical protein
MASGLGVGCDAVPFVSDKEILPRKLQPGVFGLGLLKKGMSGSASFQKARKSWQAAFAFVDSRRPAAPGAS